MGKGSKNTLNPSRQKPEFCGVIFFKTNTFQGQTEKVQKYESRMTTKRRKVHFETFWIGRASQIVREEIKVLFPVVPLEQFRFFIAFFTCVAADRSGRGKLCLFILVLLLGGLFPNCPCTFFGGGKRQLLCLKRGVKRQKLCLKRSLKRQNFASK